MITEIHRNMKRRLISADKARGPYLHDDHSALLAGTSWKDEQPAGSGTEGLTLKGTFTSPQIGSYVENVTQGFIAQIIGTTGGDLQLHYPLQTLGMNWSQADGTAAGKLIDSAASFTQTAAAGMIVALRDLSDYAVVTAVDSDTQLSLSKDIFPAGTKYSLMKGFTPGDTVRLGTAVLDGSAGHCMVEIPRFFYGHEFNADTEKHRWTIAPSPKEGLEPFPAFVKSNGGLFNAAYIGAFEGCILGRGQAIAETLTGYNLAVAKLGSYAGFQPVTNGQRSEFRKVAENNGQGWQIIDWYLNFAWQLLFLTEFESMDSQQALGDGVVNWGTTQWDTNYNDGAGYYAISHNGFSIADGNKSINKNTLANYIGGYSSYRGIENPWGNIWKWLDGVNYNDGRVYLSNDPANYEDDTGAGSYFDTGLNQPDNNGYQSKIHSTKHGLLVAKTAGNNNDFIPDYYWHNPGWRVARSGGHASSSVLAGFAALLALSSSSHRGADLGSRVCLKI